MSLKNEEEWKNRLTSSVIDFFGGWNSSWYERPLDG